MSFLTNPDIKFEDFEDEDEEKEIRGFLKDIRYDTRKADKKSSRFRTIKRLLMMRREGALEKSLSEVNPYNLLERIELFILESKADHDRLSDEMLNISKKILSISLASQEHLDNFVFNNGK